MVFSSGVFMILFLPALLILYYVFARSRAAKNITLLITSLIFYAWGEPVFVFIMIVSIFINWYLALRMSLSSHRKAFMTAAITLDVLLLFVFKYASFISSNMAMLTGNDSLRVNIALPIGISFFTFQMMSYVFDVYYAKTQAQKNPFYVALYISFFPQLIAGPIVRYNQIESEIETRNENFDDFSEGVRRFIYGLGKKVLLANFMAQIADNIFGYIINPSVLMSWLGALAYTLQIYFDFSGYSDMAIGLGLMFGFHFEENFNYPYIASSVTDFWHRWHISLSRWFRDYVYIPMGGNRVKNSRRLWNIFIVWLLTGIWHGANWTFILWGLIYFVFLVIEKKTKIIAFMKGFSHVYTMLIVILAWVIFRCESVNDGVKYIASMFGLTGNAFYDSGFIEYVRNTWLVMIFALAGVFPIVRIIRRNSWIESLWLVIVFMISFAEVISASYNPFIYFNF
ncbi:MAG: MBOAT family protein [Synergistaceae bacterium]|nr:MBOAT family protein [Synergistaceae bacterium]